jgi:PAS domain S-box-containing protein
MGALIRILHLEDNPADGELVKALLEEDGFACEIVRVETRGAFADALDRQRFDLVVSDFTLPSYDGRSALLLAKAKHPDVPVLFFSGTLGEESAIQSLRDGATDYVLKQRPARFVPAVRRALREAEERAEHKRIEKAMRETQERFIGIYESSTDAIAYLTLDGLFLDVNDSFLKLTGHTKEEILTKTYQDLTPTEYRRFESEIVQKVIRTWEPAEYEKEYIRKDGFRVAISLTVFVVKGRDGQPSGLATIIKDITERKRLEEQLRQAQKMEAIGQLTGGIAHDFNNMLTIINGYSELTLQSLKADDPLRPNLEQVKEAGERAAALTRQLLAFSRKQVLEPRVLDLNAVLTNLDRMLQRLIGEDINLVTAPASKLWRVKVDPGQIEQVIMNLAVNARDAMSQGGKLTIETANVELDEAYAREHISVKPGPYVLVAVSDTGCGMDAKTQARIFEPFFTTKEPGKGTGLGLSTVYGIVKQSGGYIWVYSEVGQGTTFKVCFPRVEAAVETVEPSREAANTVRGSETILLTEDDAALRALIRRILEKNGYIVLEAHHGKHAIEVCGQHTGPIHLLVTDVVMPEMSGSEAAGHLSVMRPDMKVLFLSGYADEAIHRHGVLVPGAAFLPKPFTPNSLARKVREVLDAPAKERT